jgi:hypothetical protein
LVMLDHAAPSIWICHAATVSRPLFVTPPLGDLWTHWIMNIDLRIRNRSRFRISEFDREKPLLSRIPDAPEEYRISLLRRQKEIGTGARASGVMPSARDSHRAGSIRREEYT